MGPSSSNPAEAHLRPGRPGRPGRPPSPTRLGYLPGHRRGKEVPYEVDPSLLLTMSCSLSCGHLHMRTQTSPHLTSPCRLSLVTRHLSVSLVVESCPPLVDPKRPVGHFMYRRAWAKVATLLTITELQRPATERASHLTTLSFDSALPAVD